MCYSYPAWKILLQTFLLVGITLLPDIAQQILDGIFKDTEEVEVYLDDNISIFSNNYEMYMVSVCVLLDCLKENGFTVNPLMCEWDAQESDWLGY
jgi:hypothetical protein